MLKFPDNKWSRRYWAPAQGLEALSFISYAQVLRLAGLTTRAPDLLKMDVEGYEWEMLGQITNHTLAPQQLAVEMHYQTQMPSLAFFGRYKSPVEILSIGTMMARRGYTLVTRNDNHACRWCTEVLWARGHHLWGGQQRVESRRSHKRHESDMATSESMA